MSLRPLARFFLNQPTIQPSCSLSQLFFILSDWCHEKTENAPLFYNRHLFRKADVGSQCIYVQHHPNIIIWSHALGLIDRPVSKGLRAIGLWMPISDKRPLWVSAAERSSHWWRVKRGPWPASRPINGWRFCWQIKARYFWMPSILAALCCQGKSKSKNLTQLYLHIA